LVEGDILETIPKYIDSGQSGNISLLHIDVDVNEPTKLILETFWDRVVPGGILMLDDYGIVEGETKAVDEFFEGQAVTIHQSPYKNTPLYIIKE